jgi:hypothetical protein
VEQILCVGQTDVGIAGGKGGGMSGSSWFALAGVVLSCLAFGVSFVAYRLQARTAKSDHEKELADQIDAIQSQMAKLGPASPSGNPMATIANISSVNAALQALLLRIATLITSADLHPDWYQNLVLVRQQPFGL